MGLHKTRTNMDTTPIKKECRSIHKIAVNSNNPRPNFFIMHAMYLCCPRGYAP